MDSADRAASWCASGTGVSSRDDSYRAVVTGARIARPGRAEVTLPPSTTVSPAMMTVGIPADGMVGVLVGGAIDHGCRIEDRQVGVGARRVMRPFFAIAGVRRSRRRAGSSVMRRSASISGTT